MHELSDHVRDAILTFSDDLAEQYFGLMGKPSFEQLTLDLDVKKEDSIDAICRRAIDIVEPLRKECNSNDKMSGVVSLIDDFKGEMSKSIFLATFDRIANNN